MASWARITDRTEVVGWYLYLGVGTLLIEQRAPTLGLFSTVGIAFTGNLESPAKFLLRVLLMLPRLLLVAVQSAFRFIHFIMLT